jgi:hypothetical protein
MWHDWEPSSSFMQILVVIDEQLRDASYRQVGGRCPRCGGPLHGGDYPRKPRGVAAELEELFARRFSWCCGREGCRKRLTPPSVRFLGRRVYLSALVFMTVVRLILEGGVEAIEPILDVPSRTVTRWATWWRTAFPQSRLWRAELGRFSAWVDEGELPLSLLERFTGSAGKRLLSALMFVAPATTDSATKVRVEAVTQKLVFALWV